MIAELPHYITVRVVWSRLNIGFTSPADLHPITAKTLFMEEYFKGWHEDIEKAGELLANLRYYLEAMLVLNCYVGVFASMRFPKLKDGAAYVKAVMEYSGEREFYEQIDLLFLSQWRRSKFREHKTYKLLKNHTEIVTVLNKLYGSEEEIKAGTRYLSPSNSPAT